MADARIDELTIEIEKTQNIGFESQHEIEKLNSEISVSKTKIENYIGHIVDYDRKKCSGIARESGIEKISYLII